MQKDEGFVLSGEEIKVLLSGLGYENVMGLFAEKDSSEYTYKKIVNSLVKMVNNNIVRSDGYRMHIDENLIPLIRCIGNSNVSIAITFPISLKVISCYCSDIAVVCMPLEYQKDRYSVYGCNLGEFLNEIVQREEFEALAKADNAPIEKRVWNETTINISDIEVFNGTDLAAKVSVLSTAFEMPEIRIERKDYPTETVPYSKESFLSVLYSLILI